MRRHRADAATKEKKRFNRKERKKEGPTTKDKKFTKFKSINISHAN